MDAKHLFAVNIRRLRREKAWSQEELASQAGLHRTYIGAVERCEKNITLVNADRIAKALGVSLVECLKVNEVEKHQ